MKDSLSIFARRLKTARLAKGITQEELGIQSGIDEFSAKARINQYENGVHAPHFEMAEKIAATLDMPTAYFYSRKDDEAEMLCLFHHMSDEAKQHLLSKAKNDTDLLTQSPINTDN
jgi:transcriptional regulator with XRE-family HTH domain